MRLYNPIGSFFAAGRVCKPNQHHPGPSRGHKIRLPLLCLLLPAIAAAAPVTLELSRSTISLDETARLTLTVEGGLQQSPPEIPLPDGLTLLSASRRDITINTRRETRIVYDIQAEKPGNYPIGPFKLAIDDDTHTLDKQTLTVTPPKVDTARDDLFITLDLSADTPYVRQTVEATLTLYSLHRIEDITLVDFPGEGFEIGEWQQVRARNRTLDGNTYRVRRYVNRLTPVKAGDYTLDPTFRLRVAVPAEVSRRDNFSMFSRRFDLRTTRLQLKEPTRLTVQAPPAEGQPDTFEGHIGRFDLQASLSPREVAVGDPLTLRVRLSGSGSLKQALPPEIASNADFRTYDSRLVEEDLRRDGLSGRKVLEQVLIPLHPDVTEIPALEFSYFDPERETYRTATAGPFPVTVTLDGGEEDPRTPGVVSSIGGALDAAAPTLVGEDLLYLKTRPGRLTPLHARAPGPGLAAGAALPFALYALLLGAAALRTRAERDPTGGRRRRAPRALRRGLDRLDLHQNPAQRATAMWTLLSDYLRDRLDLPPGDIDPDTVAAALHHQVPPPLLDELTHRLRACERARFGGPAPATDHEADPGADPETERTSFRDFMQRLDRELKA